MGGAWVGVGVSSLDEHWPGGKGVDQYLSREPQLHVGSLAQQGKGMASRRQRSRSQSQSPMLGACGWVLRDLTQRETNGFSMSVEAENI